MQCSLERTRLFRGYKFVPNLASLNSLTQSSVLIPSELAHKSMDIIFISNLVLKARSFANNEVYLEYVAQSGPKAKRRFHSLPRNDGEWEIKIMVTAFIVTDVLVFGICIDRYGPKLGSVYLDLEELYMNPGTGIATSVILEDEDSPPMQLMLDASRGIPQDILDGGDLAFIQTMNQLDFMPRRVALPLDVTTFVTIRRRILALLHIPTRVRLLSALGELCQVQSFRRDLWPNIYLMRKDCYHAAALESLKLSHLEQLCFERTLLNMLDTCLFKSSRLFALGKVLVDTSDNPLTLQRGLFVLEDALRSMDSLTSGKFYLNHYMWLDRTMLRIQLITGYSLQLNRHSDITNLDRVVTIARDTLADFMDFDRIGQAMVLPSVPTTVNPCMGAYMSIRDKLGNVLMLRFALFDLRRDLDDALARFRRVMDMAGMGGATFFAGAQQLASAMYMKFRKFGNPDDLDEGIQLMEKVCNTPVADDETDIAQIALTLADGLSLRADDLEACDRAIEIIQRAGNPDATTCAILGRCLWTRGVHLNSSKDLDAAVDMFRRACNLDPAGSINSRTFRLQLGTHLLRRYFMLHLDIDEVWESARIVSEVARFPVARSHLESLKATMIWQTCAEVVKDRSMLMEAVRTRMDIFTMIPWLSVPLSDRHNTLTKPVVGVVPEINFPSIAEMPPLATSYAIEEGDLGTAIEWLERGRSVVWNQMLQLRTPFDHLRIVDADLAKRMEELSRQLSNLAMFSQQSELMGQVHRKLAGEWEEGVEKARSLPGCESFLMPKTFEELAEAVGDSTIVIVNVSSMRCDALVVLDNDAIHVPLDLLSVEDVKRMHASLMPMMRRDFVFRAMSRKAEQAGFDYYNMEMVFKDILGELWVKVTLPILQALAIQDTSETPTIHLHWCPTGELAFLPLHAAGDYTKSARGNRVYDFVVSSYTPTLSALAGSRCRTPLEDPKRRILAVAVSSPTGQVALPGVAAEVSQLQKLAGPSCDIVRLSDANARLDSVLEEMKKVSWVHFACHASQNASHPLESALLLTGGEKLTLSEIIRADLPQAELAFLSACQTATGDVKLPSESLHLAAGMLLAGFKSVVATMWSIEDRNAPGVASDVYTHLLEGGKVSHALHHATKRLREKVGERAFLAWVPYIHVGY